MENQKAIKKVLPRYDGEFNDSHTESMSFGEFIEALATAILFILPDPYQPLGSKFEVYLLEELINAHSKYTVSALGGNK